MSYTDYLTSCNYGLSNRLSEAHDIITDIKKRETRLEYEARESIAERDEARAYAQKKHDEAKKLEQRALKAEQAHVQLFDAHQRLWVELKSVQDDRDDSNIAYRHMYEQWAKAERRVQELEEENSDLQKQVGELHYIMDQRGGGPYSSGINK